MSHYQVSFKLILRHSHTIKFLDPFKLMVHLNLSYDGDTQLSSWAYYFLLERNQNLSSSYMGLLMSVNITKVSLIIHE